MEQIKRATSPYRLHIPEKVIPILRSLRARQKDWRELIDAEDVVHLFYGLGAARFLTFDGRVIVDCEDWDGTGAYEVPDSKPKEAWSAIVLGADIFKCPELLHVLPKRPSGAIDCSTCGGVGWFCLKSVEGRDIRIVCQERCGGVGWVIE